MFPIAVIRRHEGISRHRQQDSTVSSGEKRRPHAPHGPPLRSSGLLIFRRFYVPHFLVVCLSSSLSLQSFDKNEFVECVRKLVHIDQEWVPYSTTSTLYIRPTFIGTDPNLGVAPSNRALLYVITCPVGPYYASGFKPVTLLADPAHVRAWKGGSGAYKMGR